VSEPTYEPNDTHVSPESERLLPRHDSNRESCSERNKQAKKIKNSNVLCEACRASFCHKMLQISLLYTGLTRAKKLAILVGPTKAIGLAIKRVIDRQRYTALVQHGIEKGRN
jgi:hypothetical protein